jgi:hypothetical protein
VSVLSMNVNMRVVSSKLMSKSDIVDWVSTFFEGETVVKSLFERGPYSRTRLPFSLFDALLRNLLFLYSVEVCQT